MSWRNVIPLALLLAAIHPAPAQDSKPANPLAQLSGSIRELMHRVSPAVVEVVVTGYGATDEQAGAVASQVTRQHSSGSGVVVDPAGYIMTNSHVIRGAINVKVLTAARGVAEPPESETTFDARILGIDNESDLALLKIEGKSLPAMRFGDSDALRQGDLVLAVGSPLGLRNSVSMGVVSAPARAVSDENPILYIQTDAAINPGNSGGALIDTSGALVGLNTFIASQSGGSEGIGFAIPSKVIRNVYQQLRRKGHVSRGSVGLFVQNISPVLAEGLDLKVQHGVMVSDVEPDGPAGRAGVKRKDVILGCNGAAIETARQFEDGIYRRQGGEKLTLLIQRGDDRMPVTVEVNEQSSPGDLLAALVSPEKHLVARLGIFCIEIDKQVVQLMPDLRRQYGLIVAAKSPEGQAQFIDLQAGDIIYAVNNLPMVLLSALRTRIDEFHHGDAVVLQIERNGRLRYVGFQIE